MYLILDMLDWDLIVVDVNRYECLALSYFGDLGHGCLVLDVLMGSSAAFYSDSAFLGGRLICSMNINGSCISDLWFNDLIIIHIHWFFRPGVVHVSDSVGPGRIDD